MKPITTGSCQAVTITLPKVARTAACKFLSLLPDHWLWELPSSRHFLVKVAGSGALPRQLPGSGLAVRVLAGSLCKNDFVMRCRYKVTAEKKNGGPLSPGLPYKLKINFK